MTVDVDLFDGAGGAAEGMRQVELDPIGYERWERAVETSRANGHTVVQTDLETHDWSGHPPVRLMWASPPCQPFSAAGDHEGEFDDRDGIPWWLRAVAELRPRILVMENVKGLTFEKHAAYLGRVLGEVRALGYELDWRVLDAADYGVPQNRERFILIARRDGGPLRWPTVTHTEGGGLFTAPWVTMADALGWTGAIDRRTNSSDGNGGSYPTPTVPVSRPCPTVDTQICGRWVRRLRTDQTSGSQMADAIRVETWEAARLQGFPDGYTFRGTRTEQATQIGNACPPPMVRAIVEALL